MAAERAPEPIIDNDGVVRPELYLVTDIETTPEQYERPKIVERQTGVEVSKATGDVLIGVIVQVNGQPYELSVNISRKKLGNDQPLETFFQRFETRDVDARVLAGHALHLASH